MRTRAVFSRCFRVWWCVQKQGKPPSLCGDVLLRNRDERVDVARVCRADWLLLYATGNSLHFYVRLTSIYHPPIFISPVVIPPSIHVFIQSFHPTTFPNPSVFPSLYHSLSLLITLSASSFHHPSITPTLIITIFFFFTHPSFLIPFPSSYPSLLLQVTIN